MNVLVLSNYRDYHTSRPEANIFKEMSKQGINITIMTFGDCKIAEEFRAMSVEVIDFHPQTKFDKTESQRIRKEIIDRKIDIIHAFGNRGTYASLRAIKGLNSKLVLYRGYAGNLEWWNPTSYLKHLNSRVDAIMCNSIGVKQYLDKQLGFKNEKAVVINKGHDTAWYNYEPAEIKKELNLPEDSFLLVIVANNRKMKGIPYLMKTMTMLPKSKEIHLLIAGRDMDTPENLQILKNAGVTNKVHFLGFRKDALNIVSASNVFVLSSLFGESITKSVIEAMAQGKPAIITNIPGNVELIDDGVQGYVTPVKDPKAMANAIEKMYDNPEATKKMGIAAKHRIENELSSKQTVVKLKALYENLLKK